MKRILFQGDSITDCKRARDEFYGTGLGYPLLVKAVLGKENPNEYEFINRGISGNRIVDLYARIKIDFINLKPDYASILIGVNDVWHEISNNNGVDTVKFEKIYSMLIEEIKEALPNLKLFLFSPYVLEGLATCNTEENPNRLEEFKNGVNEKREAVKRVAEKYNIPFLDLQVVFDEACKKAPAEYWAYDGVHPTPFGHDLIKEKWLEMFGQIK